MRVMARMLALCIAVLLTVTSANAVTYLVLNGSNEAFTTVIDYTDNTSQSYSIGTAPVQLVGIGTKVISAVTINGQAVPAGSVNAQVTLASGNRAYVSVLSTSLVVATIPVE